jgi:hypothetical protein
MNTVASVVTPSFSDARNFTDLPFPLTRPNAPKLSAYVGDLAAIEDSCWLSNYGPINSRLEARLVDKIL